MIEILSKYLKPITKIRNSTKLFSLKVNFINIINIHIFRILIYFKHPEQLIQLKIFYNHKFKTYFSLCLKDHLKKLY